MKFASSNVDCTVLLVPAKPDPIAVINSHLEDSSFASGGRRLCNARSLRAFEKAAFSERRYPAPGKDFERPVLGVEAR